MFGVVLKDNLVALLFTKFPKFPPPIDGHPNVNSGDFESVAGERREWVCN